MGGLLYVSVSFVDITPDRSQFNKLFRASRTTGTSYYVRLEVAKFVRVTTSTDAEAVP